MNRYRPGRRPQLYWIIALALIIAARFWSEPAAEPEPPLIGEGVYDVARVVDGDTLKLASGARVRLQGIDTPETVKQDHPVEAWGPEASTFTKDFVRAAGGEIRLTFGNERLDQYDRYLAFVWDGEAMLNEELVRAGLARARLDYHYSERMKNRLAKAQQEARDAKRGIWSGKSGGP